MGSRNSDSPNWIAIGRAILSSSLIFVGGCTHSVRTDKSSEFFVTWLKAHGETNVVVDAQGVGIAGNATRLSSSLYGSKQQMTGFTAELEFRIRIPDGREIVEYVGGAGDSVEKAEDDAKLNFAVSTFHVVYRSFLNPSDPHQTEKQATINGQQRVVVMGDTMARSQSTNSSLDMFPLRERFQAMITNLPLSGQVHWMKLVYANHHSNAVVSAVTLDNQDSSQLSTAAKELPWPKQDQFYLVKQFTIVK